MYSGNDVDMRHAALMPIETNYAPAHMLCPKCEKQMRILAIEPLVSVLDADDIIYQSGSCNYKEKRIYKTDRA
jgi:hypothetical protein